MPEITTQDRSKGRWDCGTCVQHSAEYPKLGLKGCTGRPLSHFHIGKEKELVCENGARFYLFDQGRKHARILQDLIGLRLITGRIEKGLEVTLKTFDRERISQLGKDQSPHEYMDWLADNLADWRFMVCRPFLKGATEAIEQMEEALPAQKKADLAKLIEVAESDLEKVEVDWQSITDRRERLRARRIRWGAAKRAAIFLVGDEQRGNPSLQQRIRDAAGLDEKVFHREFVVRMFMATHRISREEAEKRANEDLLGDLAKILENSGQVVEESSDDEAEESADSSSQEEGSSESTGDDAPKGGVHGTFPLPPNRTIIIKNRRREHQNVARDLLKALQGLWIWDAPNAGRLSPELTERLKAGCSESGIRVTDSREGVTAK